MADLVGSAVWAQYKSIINDGQDTFNQDTIIWLRSNGGLDRHGEDNSTEQFSVILIKGLIEYNAFRKWPTNKPSDTGEIDGQTEVLWLNIKYLTDNGWMSNSGNFNYDPSADRFIHKGIKYKSAGETNLSQAQDEPLLTMVILVREEIMTSAQLGALPIPSGNSIIWPLPPNNGSIQFPFTNTDTVVVPHPFNRYVDVTIYDTNGDTMEGEIHMDPNNLTEVVITFTNPESGTILVQ